MSTTEFCSWTQKRTSWEALKSLSVVLELNVSIPTGVLRKTIPVFVRQTEPRNVMEGSTFAGSEDAAAGASAEETGG